MTVKNNKSLKSKQLYISSILLVVSLIFFTISLIVLYASKPTTYEYGIYKLGTTIPAGSANMYINEIVYETGSGTFKAPEGQNFMILKTIFENISNDSIIITPSTQTYLKDNTGNVYFMTPFSLDQPFRAGELLPNDKISGQLSYLVPKDKSYTIYIDSIWSKGVVSVRLN